ncbi:hypothetical protein [Trichococcus collinsii]|uniref:Uncharacterized protein n=1 Tax=Trichococcus collinsii TaxID=157076 RepID=A0AB38A3Z6_9LACT|nr:hypothetical protein [Trichococcus collinsii]CZR10882.1 Hypothetical protein Tcol_3113 [Trichococcus collinsii]SEA96268.1 hypothetical protein SAMN04488525_11341 [Trichococcus collinsii]
MSMELELYKFIAENSIENHWENENKECLIWIPYYLLDGFVTKFSYFFETEDNAIGYLQHDCVCIDLVALGMDDEIDLSEIISKGVEG